jgi:glycosyltransferase involved in cell wall biosynthesis
MQGTGMGVNSLRVKCMKLLELGLCKRSAKVIVVTNGFKEVLAADGIPAKRIEVVTNGVDVEYAPRKFDENDKFILSYFGTIGLSQCITDTFHLSDVILNCVDDYEYLIIGDGAQKKPAEEYLSENKFERISMMASMPLKELETYYGKTQMSVVSLKNSDKFRHTIPSKLFQIMGRGIAVLFVGPEGETAGIIRSGNAGLILTGTPSENAKVVDKFFSQSDWREETVEMGKNGRALVESSYQRKDLAGNYIGFLDDVRRKQ